jgi:hypothetical protein
LLDLGRRLCQRRRHDRPSRPLGLTELYAGQGWPAKGEELRGRSLGRGRRRCWLEAPGWLGLDAGQLVLEAGCRDATHAIALARRYGCQVLGVDCPAQVSAAVKIARGNEGEIVLPADPGGRPGSYGHGDRAPPADGTKEQAVDEQAQMSAIAQAYLDHRLGRGRPWRRQTYDVLVGPLLAPSFAGFWRLWNPVWGYYLLYWCYRPARRMLPRAAAVLVTFTASGLAHNLLAVALSRRVNPFVTVWFTLYGVVAVVSDASGMDLSRFPGPARVAVNLAYLVGCYLLVSPLLP